jgi:oligopeptide transport system ATP-binding protein
MNPQSLLEVKDLHVTFHSGKSKLHAVRGVSFSIGMQETIGVVGESGCGKSALMKALMRLNSSHNCEIAGEAQFGSQNLLSLSEKELQKIRGKEISMIFQDPMTSLNPTMKVGLQIMEGILLHQTDLSHKQAREKVEGLLEMVGIPEAKKRAEEYPYTLSGGMRQRIMIALALTGMPQILIADEPTTSLDVTIQAQILELMKAIQHKIKMSILFITHDLSLVAGFCDKVLVMYAGKIVESATVEELFASPKHPYTQKLLQSIPRLDMPKDRPLIPIEGTPPLLNSPLKGCSFCPRCEFALNICPRSPPPLINVGLNHETACWLYDPRGPYGK